MDWRKAFDLFVFFVIVVLALATAYVCFGLLKSEAKVETGYSVSGAIAGFLITASLLLSLYLQIRKSSGELQQLQDEKKELEHKLMRGAPCPPDFEIEVDDKRRIVLAKPKAWKPVGGEIFNFEEFYPGTGSKDLIPARFSVRFVPISDNAPKAKPKKDKTEETAADRFYKKFLGDAEESLYVQECTSEYVYLGGEADSIKSLKIIARQYVSVQLQPDLLTGCDRYVWWPLTKEQYEVEKARPDDEAKTPAHSSGRSGKATPNGTVPQPPRSVLTDIWRMQVITYHSAIGYIFYFDFADDVANGFTQSSTAFNQILRSTRFLV